MTSPLRTAPWTRALGLIWRHPAVVGGVLGGCAVLGAAAAAPALFVSSAANAAQATQVDARCAGTIGATLDQAAGTEGFDRAVRAGDGIGTGDRLADRHLLVVGDGRHRRRRGAHRGQLHQPVRCARPRDPAARRGSGRRGVGHRADGPPTGPATGLHDALPRDRRDRARRGRLPGPPTRAAGDPFDSFWCSQASLLVPRGDFEDPPPPAVLVGRETFRRLALATGRRTDGPGLGGIWELPVDLTKASDGARLAAFYEELPDRVEARLVADDEPHQPLEVARSTLPFVVERTTTLSANVRNAIQPVGIAGIITALLLVGAAGAYWVDRRRDEVTMLAVRGVGPGAIGAKALLESLLAAVIGAAAGYGIAVLLVRAIGPSSVLDGAAIADGARRTAIGLAIGLVLLGVVAGARSRTLGTRRTRRARLPLAWLPWEAVPLLLAWWSHRRLQAMGSPVADGTDIPDVDLLALAFPLLFIVGTVARGGPPRDRRARPAPRPGPALADLAVPGRPAARGDEPPRGHPAGRVGHRGRRVRLRRHPHPHPRRDPRRQGADRPGQRRGGRDGRAAHGAGRLPRQGDGRPDAHRHPDLQPAGRRRRRRPGHLRPGRALGPELRRRVPRHPARPTRRARPPQPGCRPSS